MEAPRFPLRKKTVETHTIIALVVEKRTLTALHLTQIHRLLCLQERVSVFNLEVSGL